MKRKKIFGQLQRIGKSLMLPVAVLPAAALLLRFGVLLNLPFVQAAGNAIFNNLALLFAIGVAVGFAFDGSGSAGLAGVVGYFVLTEGANSINSDINMGVLAGILAGLTAGALYNRYHDIKLPDYLGFFGGKRFVPIVTGAVAVLYAGIFGYIWPPIQSGINAVGQWIIGAGATGVGIYGILNRLLIPFGLHHVLNNLVWFVFGEFTNAAGEVVTGDLTRFFAGDPEAGIFMAGMFPIMMFGLPAAALAMYHTAYPENKKAVGGMLLSVAFTSFLTGITEPIEFSFLFLAPILFGIHALLTGASMALTYLFGIKHGFGFSAGAIDYVVNYNIATKPLLLIPLGIAAFIIYYFVFRYFIKKFDISTPGRGKAESGASIDIMPEAQKEKGRGVEEGGSESTEESSRSEAARQYIEFLGGAENIEKVEGCITRLRLEVVDADKINVQKLKEVGATEVMKPTNTNVQVVVGTQAEMIAGEINDELDKMK